MSACDDCLRRTALIHNMPYYTRLRDWLASNRNPTGA